MVGTAAEFKVEIVEALTPTNLATESRVGARSGM
jgi:hypothetical protein